MTPSELQRIKEYASAQAALAPPLSKQQVAVLARLWRVTLPAVSRPVLAVVTADSSSDAPTAIQDSSNAGLSGLAA